MTREQLIAYMSLLGWEPIMFRGEDHWHRFGMLMGDTVLTYDALANVHKIGGGMRYRADYPACAATWSDLSFVFLCDAMRYVYEP